MILQSISLAGISLANASHSYLDFVTITTYDYHGSGDLKTGFNAPLYGSQGDQLTVVSHRYKEQVFEYVLKYFSILKMLFYNNSIMDSQTF